MLNVTKFYVRSLDLDHLDLFWEIGPLPASRVEGTPHEVFDYDFYVLRSGDSPGGPYEILAGPFRDQYMLRDNTVSLLHSWREYFYKLRVVHRPTGTFEEFGPSSSDQTEPDLIASAIIREEDILFREFIGRKCWLFKSRTFGPLCTCFDVTLGRRLRTGHQLCFDTGFLGGYMSPIEVWAQVDPPGKDNTAHSFGEVQQCDTMGRLISFPPVSPRDILVESDNERWRVIKTSQTERLRHAVHQELTLHHIPKGDVEYNLPVEVDLQNLLVAADRNFTNPTSVAKDGDFDDITAFWRHPRGSS